MGDKFHSMTFRCLSGLEVICTCMESCLSVIKCTDLYIHLYVYIYAYAIYSIHEHWMRDNGKAILSHPWGSMWNNVIIMQWLYLALFNTFIDGHKEIRLNGEIYYLLNTRGSPSGISSTCWQRECTLFWIYPPNISLFFSLCLAFVCVCTHMRTHTQAHMHTEVILSTTDPHHLSVCVYVCV